MDDADNPAPPKTLADQLTDIPVGSSRVFTNNPDSVRATITRVKAAHGGDYTTRPEDGALRVWRLA